MNETHSVMTGVNVAHRLSEMAGRTPDAIAIAEPIRQIGANRYRTITFAELEADTNRIASGLIASGVTPRMRIALLVRPGIDFIATVFALLKCGAVQILIDPGMGRKNLLKCLAEAEPEGIIAIPLVQAVRMFVARRFGKSHLHVTVGRRWFWKGPTLDEVRRRGNTGRVVIPTTADDPAAIIFTTGSTGPPKGVLYRHGNFDRQVTELRDFYGIKPGEIDLPGFPLFGLFNCAMGVTTIVPEMDPSRPAKADPRKFTTAIHEWSVTQSFGSPAIWNRVGQYCQANRVQLPTVRRILSAGAPVPPHVLERMKACIHRDGDIHTPYGATEALPIASISASEVLGETALQSRQGAGTCVGRRFPGIAWKIIEMVDGPIANLAAAKELPTSQIGELIVCGPVVTQEYVTRLEANALGKITDGNQIWHRMGDVGYFDEQERFWFCGRLAHRVLTAEGPMFTIPCEAIFNNHRDVYRSALVGVGPAGKQKPVIIVELWPGVKRHRDRSLIDELRALGSTNSLTASIDEFLVHPAMPVDIRHNAKIFREKLAVWATTKVGC